MLNTLREKVTGTFAVIILGLIALSLVVTFGNIDTGFSGATTAATVNGEEVPMQEFRSLYQRQRQQWEAGFGSSIPDEVAVSLAENVLQSIVRNRAVSQHAQEQGYRINDSDVIAAIRQSPVFQVGGRFSQPAYEQLLSSEGLSPQRFEFEQRQTMQVSQFLEGIGYTAFYTPAEFRRYIELDGETRAIEYAVLSADSKMDGVTVTDAEVQEWYEANPMLYQTEESVTLEYIEIDYADVLAGVAVSESDAREYFQSNISEFGGVEERRASHILLAGDDSEQLALQAADVLTRIENGESFAELAAELSADRGSAANGGSLGWLSAGDTPAPAFEDALYTLQRGEISEPVQTEFGVHLIRLDDIRDGARPDFAQVAEELQQQLRQDEAVSRFNELLDELDERALESIDGLAPVAEAMGLPLQTVDEFRRNGGGQPIADEPALVDTVFSLEVLEDGENSPIVGLDDDRAVVVRVAEHRLPALKPLEDVRDDIRAELEAEKAVARVRDTGSRIVEQLNSDEPVSEVLAAEGLELQQLPALRRGDEQLPADLVSAVFRSPVSDEGSYQSQLLANGDFALYRVVSVESGRAELFSQEDRDARKAQLAGRLGGGQATAVVEQLVRDAKVNIAPDLIETELGLQ